ncbi:3-keto-5-aminohexanoate cleavage protein [Aliiroseovarius sp. KMU-50]|uniref:3-keto-5-aminohexanoate cleavage protein n=1 Tax=Aliiroseovarius salicola TaxID=3009082 RepID=A0ABT4VY46_9RHOB|nr:3-keto-5-aminohexanoate cleavage protein [Aliiroseovarius sp. KMU-50]MDA5092650.1 3-keto-5-aminohexanoate cleavage protein [Aliiroseovarius sp. KMU-50]
MTPLPKIMVAPNGARKGKVDHPALPITKDEIVVCARDCFDAGADGLHLHIRDADGGHLLDVETYQEVLAALKVEVPDMAIQITTEAVGIYAPDVQKQVALEVGANLVSVSIAEMCRDDETGAREFYETCAARGIAIQHILYGREDCALLARVLPKAMFCDRSLQLLFVLGRYSDGQVSQPSELQPFLYWMEENALTPDWGLCAFGPHETDCLVAAYRAGGKCRIGFENSFFMADGCIAQDNAARVTELVSRIS